MYKILDTEDLAPGTHTLKIEAPAVARKAQAGQFVMLRVDEKGERIPLTIADWDKQEGSVTLVFATVGTTTSKLARLKTGDSILNFVGPLGLPSQIQNYGTVVCVAGGVGAAPITPIARAMKQAGNKVITILGARNKDLLFYVDKLTMASSKLIITTDDGSYGRKGLVTEPLKELLESQKIDLAVIIGPGIMMKFGAKTTEPFKVKTVVSLNPIMVEGTGMCGCCRVSIGGVTKFACIDGPEFDGHQVDWDLLMFRQRFYLPEEKLSFDEWKAKHPVKN